MSSAVKSDKLQQAETKIGYGHNSGEVFGTEAPNRPVAGLVRGWVGGVAMIETSRGGLQALRANRPRKFALVC